MRTSRASREGAVNKGPNGPEPPEYLTLRFTRRTPQLRASLL